MANRKKRSNKKDQIFLQAIADGKTLGVALHESTYKRQTVYDWRESDPDWAKAWDEAKQAAVERMEQEADRRAIEGVNKPVYQRGELVGHVREYSDTLLIFRLKALAPDKYRENHRLEHTGADGGPVEVEISARDKLANIIAGIVDRERENTGTLET